MSSLEFVSKKFIDKGWSKDKKYCVKTSGGTKYLLRLGGAYEKVEYQHKLMNQAASLGVEMCRPVECGICAQGVYAIQTWIDGKDAEQVIPDLKNSEQYIYGVNAGKTLKLIHSIPAPESQTEWDVRFNQKIDRKIKMYNECEVKFNGAENMVEYINANRYLLKNRPQSFQHGDYHIGNMMIENDKLIIIDFDKFDFGDPWEEFNRIVWSAQKAPAFAAGILNGYFDDNVPEEFWKLLAVYIGSNTLSSVAWAVTFGEEQIQVMLNQAYDVLRWYDKMKNIVPSWYTDFNYL